MCPEKPKTIASYFVEDHKAILQLVNTISEKQNSSDELKKQLKWHIDRHFYIEEKVIYSFIERTQLMPPFLEQFLLEHNSIYNCIKEIIIISNPLEMAKDLVLSIGIHVKSELKKIYPYIERNLEGYNREKVVGEIEQSIKLGFYPLQKLRNFYSDKLNIPIPALDE